MPRITSIPTYVSIKTYHQLDLAFDGICLRATILEIKAPTNNPTKSIEETEKENKEESCNQEVGIKLSDWNIKLMYVENKRVTTTIIGNLDTISRKRRFCDFVILYNRATNKTSPIKGVIESIR